MEFNEAILTRISLASDEVLLVQANLKSREDRDDLRRQIQPLFPANRIVIWPKDWKITAVKQGTING